MFAALKFPSLKRIADALELANRLRIRADAISERNEDMVRKELLALKNEQRVWMARIETQIQRHIEECDGLDVPDLPDIKH